MTAIIDDVIKDEIPFPAVHLTFFPIFAAGTLISGGRIWFRNKKDWGRGGRGRLGGQRNLCLSFALICEERRLIPVNILCTRAIRM